MKIACADEAAMQALGAELADKLAKPSVITLSGELGAGKSVLARAIIHALGHTGSVKSPTYTLVENYSLSDWQIAHLDLYRLQDPEELQFIGFRDIVAANDLLLIEWPEQAQSLLPRPDIVIDIQYSESGRQVQIDRHH